MVVIRPVQPADLDRLLELAHFTGYGLTTLPKDREFLARRIARSRRSFEGMGDQPAGESYLFVLEDRPADLPKDAPGKVIGTCGIVSKVGGFEPFYAYRIETTVHESAFLGVRKEIRTLHLVAEHNGPCEIGSLFLSPDYRTGGNGRLLSLARFLFMAEHGQCFDPLVIAEMRGVIDAAGRSPFWDAVGHHFFDIEFPKADYLSLVNKRFIADLMPKHPVYVPLLPPDAQAVVGHVHEQTRPALRLLEGEGFRSSGMVDIFEAGPVVTCPVREIRTVRESRRAAVAEIADGPAGGDEQIVATTRPGDFRACRGTVELVPAGGARIGRDVAEALAVGVGDAVRHVPMRAAARPAAASTAQGEAAAFVI